MSTQPTRPTQAIHHRRRRHRRFRQHEAVTRRRTRRPTLSLILKAAAHARLRAAARPGRSRTPAPAAAIGAGHRPAARALRPGNPQDRARPRLHRGRRAPLVRQRGHHRQGPRAHRALRKGRHRPRAHPDQDRLHLGGHQGRRAARRRRGIHCNLTLLFSLRPGRRLRRGRRAAHLALRRPHPRLVQEEHRQGLRRRPRIPACMSVTQIYNYYKKFGYKTEVMGATLPQQGRDHRARRLRPAHHQPRRCSANCRPAPSRSPRKLDPAGRQAADAQEGHLRRERPSASRSTRTPWPRRKPPRASASSPPTS